MTQRRPRYNTSRDANQAAIMADLRQLGFYVRDVSAHISEWDIEVYGHHAGYGCRLWGHFEIKTKTGKAQLSQSEFAQAWGYDAAPVVRSTEHILDWYERR